jgi:signal transduction histidine kinase
MNYEPLSELVELLQPAVRNRDGHSPMKEQGQLDRAELIRLFSVLSHDLKSPIFTIDGFSDLLLADYADRLDEEGRDFLQRVRNGVAQMKKILEEMGRVVKLLSREDAPESVSLDSIIDEIRLRHSFALEERGLRLEIVDSLPEVRGDREKVRELFDALVSNAIAFTDSPAEKGSAPDSQRVIRIDCSTRDAMAEISVVDQGLGIEPQYHDQIFDLGIKLDKSRGAGPGYGLFLARKIVEGHGGALELDSVPGEGSRFVFTLPLT